MQNSVAKFTLEHLPMYIKYFWARRKTKFGYVLGVVLIVLFLNFLTDINDYSVSRQLLIYSSSFLSTFILWLFISGRRFLPSNNLKIGIALKSTDPSSQTIIDSTFSRIKDKLKLLNLLDKFNFYELGTDIFETNEQAEEFGLKRDLNLIIHGSVYRGKVESKYRYDLKNFFFTCTLKNTPKDYPGWGLISADINLMLANRNWIIDESNDLTDIEGVANNLFEIMLSVIAIGLSRSTETIDSSIILIEKLLPILDKQIDPKHRQPKISKDKKHLLVPIDLLRTGRLRAILNGCYINMSRSYIVDGDYKKAINIAEKGLDVGANKVDSFAVIALANFHLGNIELAEEYTDKINTVSKGNQIYLVNKAFFSILRKEYKKVISYYDDLRGKITKKHNMVDQVLGFLSDRLKEDGDEYAYYFSMGILTYNFRNEKEGKQILSKFMKKAKGIDNYSSMIRIANKIAPE